MKKLTMVSLLFLMLLAIIVYSIKLDAVAESISKEVVLSHLDAAIIDENSLVDSGSDIFSNSGQELVQESLIAVAEEVEKLSDEEVAQAILRGEYGNGAERIAKVESMGYDYAEIQKIVNRLVPRKTVVKSEYKANTVYIKNTVMPFKVSNIANQTADIDGTWKTWVTTGSYPNWSPYDNKGTFFAQHNDRGGDVIMKLNYGDVVIVTDGNKAPYKYVVDKIIRNNMATEFNAELSGDLDKEYLIFQTCEYGDGNIHVFATRLYE